MISISGFVYSVIIVVWYSAQTVPVFGQEPILPRGDPRLQRSEEEQARQEDAHNRRLKQQGQGSNYRIEGEPQPSAGTTKPSSDSGDLSSQDTPISDPSVNPGQAAGMEHIQGRIVDSKADLHVVHQQNGTDITLVVDAETTGDTDLHPGDVVTGIITPEGRAVAIHKKEEESSSPKER